MSDYTYIDSVEEAQRLAAALSQHKWVNFDTETTGLDPHTSEIRLMQFGIEENGSVHSYLVDCFKVPPSVFRAVMESDESPMFVGHNLAFDCKMLLSNNIRIRRVWDTMVGAKIVEAGMQHMVGKHNLAAVAHRTIGIELDKAQQQSNWAGDLTDEQLEYAALDVQYPYQIAKVLQSMANKEGLDMTLALEMNVVPVTAWMEFRGLHVDEAVIERLKVEYAQLIEEREATVREMVGMRPVTKERKVRLTADERDALAISRGVARKEVEQWRTVTEVIEEPWNLESGKQIMEWMRSNGIAIPKKKAKDDDGNIVYKETVDADALEQMEHPFARALVNYRRVNRALNVYVEPLLGCRNPITKNVHCSLDQCKDSGRYSASKPPLQQIPRDSDLRSMFVPDPGKLLIISDYSQIELVLIAMMSRDPVMCDLFKKGGDLHAHTATNLFGVSFIQKGDARRKDWEHGATFDGISPWSEANKARSIAKNFNFASWYGAWVDTVARIIRKAGHNMPNDQIETMLKAMHTNHPTIVSYFEQVTAKAIEAGYSETIIGRRRYYYKPRTRAEAKAISLEANNTTIQGSGADINKAGLIEIYKHRLDLRMTIHDEVLVVTDPDKAEENARLVQDLMVQGAMKIVERARCPIDKDVPIKAETKVGTSWAEK
jgi:DNA polymerase-1